MNKGIKSKIFGLVTVAVTMASLTGCASMERSVKSFSSDLGNGLNRTMTVYDYNGHKLATYKGNFDIQVPQANEIMFDLDGKRHIIYNAIVITDEN